MCGIVGFSGTGGRDDLTAMTNALSHRGPDAEGYHVDKQSRVYLGHRRLSVRDIAGGQQPMWNEDRSVCVVYNGEIYNHVELRKELEAHGHIFSTDHSDTEVLVHGFEQWGKELPRRLNGMFAFAIFESRDQTLFLARDRFGEKPLYYANAGGAFAFASELHALTLHPAVGREYDPAALQKFFAYGYIPAPLAAFKKTYKLPHGHHLSFSCRTGKLNVESYHTFLIDPDPSLERRDEEDLAMELRSLLDQAVQRRLVSDVPLGVFLSGGIDSSAVLALTANHRDAETIEAFTIGFNEASFDESPHARRMVKHLGVKQHQRLLSIDEARDQYAHVLARMDEPMADPSVLPTYLLCGLTREHVTVALSGDGGDELFAGYDPFKALGPASLYHRMVPSPLHTLFRGAAACMPVSNKNMSLEFKIKRTLMGLSYDQALWSPVWMSLCEPDFIEEMFASPLPAEELYSEALTLWNQSLTDNLTDRTLEFFTNFYLPNGILTKVDRASMMHSLETRAVFLDNDVTHFARRLPHRFKFRNGKTKYLLKRALRGLLPGDIIERRKKGFGIPLAKWLRDVPPKPPLTPITGIDSRIIESCWSEHRKGKNDHRLLLWGWLCVQHHLAAQNRT